MGPGHWGRGGRGAAGAGAADGAERVAPGGRGAPGAVPGAAAGHRSGGAAAARRGAARDAAAATPQPGNPLRPIWEASLAAREEALARAQAALTQQLDDLRKLEAQVGERLKQANARFEAANKRWEDNARLRTPSGETVPQTVDEANAQLDKVVAIIKKMKPSAAAAMASKWSDELTVDVLARLPARVASPVLAQMAAKDAARVTAMLARGGAPTPAEVPVDATAAANAANGGTP